MKKENDTEKSEVVAEPITQEDVKIEEGEVEVAKPEKLSRRDALEVAIAATKAPEKTEKPEPKVKEKEIQASPEPQKLTAPAEYTAEEKADFEQLSRKGQEAQLRLDRSRKAKIEEIKAATREHEGLKKLSEAVNPYLKAIGVKEPSEVALQKALKMWREFEDGDPKQAAAAYLRAKGIEPPKELLSTDAQDEKISPLQEKLNALENRIAQKEQAEFGSVLGQAWTSFEQEKNAGGQPKYPDINESESGLRMASSIGSLVNGQTALSQQFIANVKSRIPNLTYPALLQEAYRYCGGKVNDSEAPRTQTTQKQIAKSSRAASSVPGGAAQSSSKVGKKFKSYREAAEAALADIRETEGA